AVGPRQLRADGRPLWPCDRDLLARLRPRSGDLDMGSKRSVGGRPALDGQLFPVPLGGKPCDGRLTGFRVVDVAGGSIERLAPEAITEALLDSDQDSELEVVDDEAAVVMRIPPGGSAQVSRGDQQAPARAFTQLVELGMA